jgi:hypothetical protein
MLPDLFVVHMIENLEATAIYIYNGLEAQAIGLSISP